ncbi:uncharacterized protein LOC142318144 [Lycorma delicatula]|uniref:uncharacterized protein LOC142318144 n=1 Tax=Lycorma delicatula TaxID=130591 RepID=UPI003F51984B
MEFQIKFFYVTVQLLSWLQNTKSIKLKYMKEEKLLLHRKAVEIDPCYRECVIGQNMICKYEFLVESYNSMGLNCKNCPFNESDCSLPECVPGGGIQRPIITVNRRAPGPDIQVCENDTIVVDVINTLKTEGITIHWHGLHQVGTPYMDGTPYITQCPILPYNTFRYQFVASPHGTHIWHGHVGFQDCDGLYGKLIVRRQENKKFRKLYDYDLPEHTVVVWHWYNWTTQGILENVLHINGSVYGFGLLINGKGVLKEFQADGNVVTTPREVFYVTQGKRYLFRLLANSAIYCPVQVSIDNHTILMTATGTTTFEPIEVDTFVVSAGERFNFILQANQKVGCYWMRFRGIGDCGEMKSSVHQEAHLCYNGSKPSPYAYYKPTYNEGKRSGILFNPVEVVDTNLENNSLIYMPSLKSIEPPVENISGTPNVTLYVQLHSRIYDTDYPGPWPQFNNITFEFPERPLLPQRDELTSESTCSIDRAKQYCVRDYCMCPYIEEIPLNALVEMVLVDISTTRQQDHPVHIHGSHFYILAIEPVGYNISFDLIKQKNERGEIKKVFNNLPGKDTISVPNKGFSIIRFVARNPGYWLFHCHVSNHMELGMAMVLKVGSHSNMAKVPADFPKCGNWVYKPDILSSGTIIYSHYSVFLYLVFYYSSKILFLSIS